jgi:hypothetical protein
MATPAEPEPQPEPEAAQQADCAPEPEAVPEPQPEPAAGSAPTSPQGRGRLVQPLLMVVGLVVGAVAVRVLRPDQGVQLIDSSYAEVTLAAGGGTALWWAGVVGNPRSDAAEYTTFELDILDGEGNVLGTYIEEVGVLLPGQTVGVGGVFDDPGAARVRVESRGTRAWRPADAFGELTVDDVSLGYTHLNEPIVEYTVTSGYDEPIAAFSTSVLFRDTAGRIVGSASSYRPDSYPPLEPGTPVTGHVKAGFVIPRVATAEVYVLADRREPD